MKLKAGRGELKLRVASGNGRPFLIFGRKPEISLSCQVWIGRIGSCRGVNEAPTRDKAAVRIIHHHKGRSGPGVAGRIRRTKGHGRHPNREIRWGIVDRRQRSIHLIIRCCSGQEGLDHGIGGWGGRGIHGFHRNRCGRRDHRRHRISRTHFPKSLLALVRNEQIAIGIDRDP